MRWCDEDRISIGTVTCLVGDHFYSIGCVRMTCSVGGCSRPVSRQGMCGAHRMRMRRYGTPHAGRAFKGEPLAFLMSAVVEKTGACVLWPYGRTTGGYGTVTIEGELQYVHRVVCEIKHGPPETAGQQARHICGNGHLGCFNPDHLQWGTGSENQMDRVLHDTSNRGTRHPQNKLTEAQVLEIYNDTSKDSDQLGALYGVNRRTVIDIFDGRTWAWLTGYTK